MRSTAAEMAPERLEVREQGKPLVAPPLGENVEFGNTRNLQPLLRDVLDEQRAGLRGSQSAEQQRHEESELVEIAGVDEVDRHGVRDVRLVERILVMRSCLG